MQQFLFLFVGLALQPADDSSQTQAYAKSWVEWMGELAAKGQLVSGSPLEARGKVVQKDSAVDLQLQRMDIGGFMLVRAESLDEAIVLSQQAPHMALGGTTIVRPCLETNRTI